MRYINNSGIFRPQGRLADRAGKSAWGDGLWRSASEASFNGQQFVPTKTFGATAMLAERKSDES